jgi:four helix bundle protein
MSHSYRQLLVWQKARSLAVALYQATETFPKSEIYGLTSQLRRAGVSVVSNIAKGQGRLTKGEFRHFLGQSRGSVLEFETQLDIAFELDYLNAAYHEISLRRAYEVLGLLNRLLPSLRIPVPAGETPKPVNPETRETLNLRNFET